GWATVTGVWTAERGVERLANTRAVELQGRGGVEQGPLAAGSRVRADTVWSRSEPHRAARSQNTPVSRSTMASWLTLRWRPVLRLYLLPVMWHRCGIQGPGDTNAESTLTPHGPKVRLPHAVCSAKRSVTTASRFSSPTNTRCGWNTQVVPEAIRNSWYTGMSPHSGSLRSGWIRVDSRR